MANQEQLDLLKQGRDVWNTWRKQHPSLRPDLSGADLSFATQGGAILREVFDWGTDLSEANLSGANLRRANLSQANLSGASLSRAYLRQASLTGEA